MKTVYLEKKEMYEDEKCTFKQKDFIEDLMYNKPNVDETLRDIWLNYLAYNTREILSKKQASVLIGALIKKEDIKIDYAIALF